MEDPIPAPLAPQQAYAAPLHHPVIRDLIIQANTHPFIQRDDIVLAIVEILSTVRDADIVVFKQYSRAMGCMDPTLIAEVGRMMRERFPERKIEKHNREVIMFEGGGKVKCYPCGATHNLRGVSGDYIFIDVNIDSQTFQECVVPLVISPDTALYVMTSNVIQTILSARYVPGLNIGGGLISEIPWGDYIHMIAHTLRIWMPYIPESTT